jgi:1,4-alpha-glucan branching enzyme
LRATGWFSIGVSLAALGCGGGGSARAVSGGDGSATGAPGAEDGGAGPPDATTQVGDAGPTAPATVVALGATALDGGGVEFRVWAPNADGVSVKGAFAAQPIALAEDDGGVFDVVVDAAQVGQAYSYVVKSGGQELERLDPHARDLNGSQGVIVDPRAYAWKAPAFTMPPKNESVIYELHVGSFGGDASSGAPGTFASVASKLPWLCDLGVSAIELMPSNEFGGDGWGYNPDAYFAPHVGYGASADLRALIDAAHACGIGVILDVVYNHYDGWSQAPLYCFDGYCPPDDGGAYAGVYFFADPTYAMTPWGPRFDYSNPRVSDFVTDGALAWFSEYRADGLRWDSTANIRALDGSGSVPGGADVLQRANTTVHALRPDALLVAEDLKGDATVTASTADGGLGFDTQWDSFGSVVSAVTATSDAARDIDAVNGTLTWGYNGDPFERLVYDESHDTVGNGGSRLPDQIDSADPTSLDARKLTLLAAAALLTTPGVPMLFMGEEMLATGTFAQTPAPLDWTLSTTNAPIVLFYKNAIRLRRNLDGTAAGLLGPNVSVFHVNETGKVLGYLRSDQAGNDVVVLLNFGVTAYPSYLLGLPESGTWHVRLNTDDQQYSSDFGGSSSADVVATSSGRDGYPVSGSIALGSYAAVVLSQ